MWLARVRKPVKVDAANCQHNPADLREGESPGRVTLSVIDKAVMLVRGRLTATVPGKSARVVMIYPADPPGAWRPGNLHS